jgi:hypothetical protein
MIPWEVSMKFEQFKPLFQILQIMEKHYAGGYHKSTASTVVCQNLNIWNSGMKLFKILWNFQTYHKIF